jgi:hypothetical protein
MQIINESQRNFVFSYSRSYKTSGKDISEITKHFYSVELIKKINESSIMNCHSAIINSDK